MKRWQKKFLFGIFFALVALIFLQKKTVLSSSYIGEDVSVILAAMPKRDREKLEYFFRGLIIEENFGYVLLGKKPMAFATSWKKINSLKQFLPYKIAPRWVKYRDGLQIWEKYEKFFPTTRFLLFEGEYDHSDDPNILVLINKKEFAQKVEECIDDFTSILQYNTSGERLLQECRFKPLFSDLLAGHQGLFGILLGFGRENAYLFHQRSQLSSEEERKDFSSKLQFHSSWPEEEYEKLFNQFESMSWISKITGSYLKDIELIALPGFACILSSPETRYWQKHYLKQEIRLLNTTKIKTS